MERKQDVFEERLAAHLESLNASFGEEIHRYMLNRIDNLGIDSEAEQDEHGSSSGQERSRSRCTPPLQQEASLSRSSVGEHHSRDLMINITNFFCQLPALGLRDQDSSI